MIMLSATSMSVILIVVCADFQNNPQENAKVAFRLSLVTLTTLSHGVSYGESEYDYG